MSSIFLDALRMSAVALDTGALAYVSFIYGHARRTGRSSLYLTLVTIAQYIALVAFLIQAIYRVGHPFVWYATPFNLAYAIVLCAAMNRLGRYLGMDGLKTSSQQEERRAEPHGLLSVRVTWVMMTGLATFTLWSVAHTNAKLRAGEKRSCQVQAAALVPTHDLAYLIQHFVVPAARKDLATAAVAQDYLRRTHNLPNTRKC